MSHFENSTFAATIRLLFPSDCTDIRAPYAASCVDVVASAERNLWPRNTSLERFRYRSIEWQGRTRPDQINATRVHQAIRTVLSTCEVNRGIVVDIGVRC